MRPSVRRHQRAFTLVELLAAMTGGLIVTTAIVGVSKNATQAFYRESRVAATEMSLRLSVERLRADLQRASYMSTGNILSDPKVPLNPIEPKVPGGSVPGIANLQGIRFSLGGSSADVPLSTTAANGFAPDSIDITGNMTGTEDYPVRVANDSGGPNCGGQVLYLQPESPAIWRVRGGNADNALLQSTLQQQFQPVARREFLVRITDEEGRSQFAVGCGAGTAGYSNAEGPYVELALAGAINLSRYGLVAGRLSVNPVHSVRWSMRSTAVEYTALTDSSGIPKYDLVRQWVDANLAVAGTPEIVGEYAVDMQFGFSADTALYQAGAQAPAYVNYAFGSPASAALARPVSTAVAATLPQRIRSVRVRFSTRTDQPDATSDARMPGNNYTLRYCTKLAGCTAGLREWSSVRTLTTELLVPNQSGMFY